jgi:NAD(P)-dependent dehydrogenase (short-subunit alcohol dehydrogenase family)
MWTVILPDACPWDDLQCPTIAQAIAFLANEKQSGYVNGHTLSVDGGWTADGSWETLRLRHR